MSDLSQPPLTLMPPDTGFAWPLPELPGYTAPATTGTAEPCEVEGLNGQSLGGRLLGFDLAGGQLLMRPTNGRSFMSLRFDQFRRVRLTAPLPAPQLPEPDALLRRPAQPFTLTFQDGSAWKGLVAAHRAVEAGVFLFEPVDTAGALRRSFVPRAAIKDWQVGERIGEALVAQRAATPDQVDEALAEQQALRQRKLGDMLVVRQIITADELATAIEQQARMPMVRIGEALTALGFITEPQLQEALALQRNDRSVPLGELLVKKGVVSRADLQTALSRKMGYPLVDAANFPVEIEALVKLPYAAATRVPALPLMLRGGRLIVAMEDPSNRRAIDELEFAAQCKLVPVLARNGVLVKAIDRAYEKLGAATRARAAEPAQAVEFDAIDASELLASLESGPATEEHDDEPGIEQSDNSLVRLINSMILEAQGQGVSDIHIECRPGREKVAIRFRKDGLLRPYLELPHTYRSALIARLKIMCDLDISERRKPQDGKINFGKFVQGSRLELRLATIPTSNGVEDAVMRLLASSKPIPIDELGLAPRNLERFKAAAQRPYGMVLCVGPTGSGKTTTLHSALSLINTPERKIWTAEDPVEITQSGLRQVQVNPKIDWTFAKALRSFLRADPDVIMVGEIRDGETAQVSIEASLTGHLVLSTLHTNSAPETVTRLLDMGMDPFNFADALLAVLAQRLVRRICTGCRTAEPASAEYEEELLRDYQHPMAGVEGAPADEALLAEWRERFGQDGRLVRYRGVGCDRCGGSGFRGRAGIHELMTVSRTLRHLVQTGARADELQKQALADGMRTLRQDGIEKVLAGVTTIEEVRSSS